MAFRAFLSAFWKGLLSCGESSSTPPKNISGLEITLSVSMEFSGKTHQVYTAVSIKTHDKILTQTDVADVSFLDISEEEIDFYVDKFQPMDKAGSYGIQEWLGMAKIDKINGSFYTIMGLPTAVVYDMLKNI